MLKFDYEKDIKILKIEINQKNLKIKNKDIILKKEQDIYNKKIVEFKDIEEE